MNKNNLLHWRRTKIIATIGPASDTEKKISDLIKAGVNVFRLNMSHGDHDYHKIIFKRIRACSKKQGVHSAILMDLCGPKIRTGKFENGSIVLKKNSTVIFSCSKKIGKDGLIVSQYKRLCNDVKKGERILLDDGNLECRIESIMGKEVICKVVYGGVLKDNKGINLPDSTVSAASFTQKDKNDVKLVMDLKADFVALSFVRSAKDIVSLKRYMKRTNIQIPIIAKIEKPEAVKHIDSILESAYGVMIARGDLGIELPAEKVPMIQKQIINKARLKNRPVIVATQMMESMVNSARPTRAEVGDVAGAAMSSTDAVMLSAETAIGKYPVKTVRMMDKILREIESDQLMADHFGHKLNVDSNLFSLRRAVSHAANSLAKELELQGILVPTSSGITAGVLSADRPSSPLLAASENVQTCQRLSLHWGVLSFHIKNKKVGNWNTLCNLISHQYKLTKTGDRILLVSGFNDKDGLSEPVLKIIKMDG